MPHSIKPSRRLDLGADQRAVEVDRGREPAQLMVRQGPRLVEEESVQAVRRSAGRRKARGVRNDQPEADRALLLAEEARLVAGGEDGLEDVGRGQRVVVVHRLAVLVGQRRAVVPRAKDDLREVGRIRMGHAPPSSYRGPTDRARWQ